MEFFFHINISSIHFPLYFVKIFTYLPHILDYLDRMWTRTNRYAHNWYSFSTYLYLHCFIFYFLHYNSCIFLIKIYFKIYGILKDMYTLAWFTLLLLFLLINPSIVNLLLFGFDFDRCWSWARTKHDFKVSN